MAAFVAVLILTGVLFVLVPKGFIPEQDTDQIAVTTEAAQGTSYDKLVEYQDKVSKHHPPRIRTSKGWSRRSAAAPPRRSAARTSDRSSST